MPAGRPISFWLRNEDIDALDAEAAKRGETRSQLVVNLIRDEVFPPEPDAQ